MFKEYLLIRDLTGGINTEQRSNKIKENELVSIVGWDFDANTLRRAKGYTKLGTEPEDLQTGKTLYKHQKSDGTEILIKSIGTTLKFYDTVTETWYALTSSTFTSGLAWTFASAYGYLYGNNGTDNWVFWNANANTTTTTITLIGAVTIDMVTTANLAASGDIMIEGEIISYSGKTASQLTGVTGVDANHASGSTVIQKLDSSTYSSLDQAQEIAFHKNRFYMIDKDNRTILRYSKLADNSAPETDIVNFTVVGSGAGDAGFQYAKDEMISIKEYINGNAAAVLIVFCKNGVAYVFTVTDTTTTTSAFTPARTMGVYPLNVNAVTIAENDVAFTDQYNHIRTLGFGDVNTPIRVETISSKIEPSLEATYFQQICMAYHNRKLYAGGATVSGGTNDIFYYHDSNYNSWGAYGHWDAICFAEYNGDLCALSAVTGNVWKLDDGYSVYVDDSAENNEGDYSSEAVTRSYDWNEPFQYKKLLKLRMSGFITSNAQVYLDVYFDGVLFTTFLISGNNTNIQGSLPEVAVGTIVFGQGVFGGSVPGGTVRKLFVAQLNFSEQSLFLQAQFRLRMEGKNVDFEMNDFAAWADEQDLDYWLPSKIITNTYEDA